MHHSDPSPKHARTAPHEPCSHAPGAGAFPLDAGKRVVPLPCPVQASYALLFASRLQSLLYYAARRLQAHCAASRASVVPWVRSSTPDLSALSVLLLLKHARGCNRTVKNAPVDEAAGRPSRVAQAREGGHGGPGARERHAQSLQLQARAAASPHQPADGIGKACCRQEQAHPDQEQALAALPAPRLPPRRGQGHGSWQHE